MKEALRSAKLDALRRGALPSEWAAFTAVGDPSVTIPLRAPSPLGRWWPMAITALAVAVLTAYSLRTRRGRRGEAR